MRWNANFYFDKRDRSSIIFLLVLLVLSILVYILINNNQKVGVLLTNEYSLSSPCEKFVKRYKIAIGETIDVNSVDTISLMTIPGIGPIYSRRIVNYRERLGGFVSIEQLKEVRGIDNEVYQKIKDYIRIDGQPTLLRINGSTYKELIRHPYLNKKQVNAILDLSKRKGRISSLKRLALLEEFSEEDIKRLEPYLSFD